MSGNPSQQVDLLFKEISRIDKTVERMQASVKSHSDLTAASKLRIEMLEQASEIAVIKAIPSKESKSVSKVEELRRQLYELLNKEPVDGPDLWKYLQPLDLSVFEEHIAKCSPHESKIDLSSVILKSSDSNAFETVLHGKTHGFIRTVDANKVAEATHKYGQLHGLSRVIEDSQVRITLNYEGSELAYIHYNQEARDTERGGQFVHLLRSLPTELYKPAIK